MALACYDLDYSGLPRPLLGEGCAQYLHRAQPLCFCFGGDNHAGNCAVVAARNMWAAGGAYWDRWHAAVTMEARIRREEPVSEVRLKGLSK